jgi:hypothetical protein
MSANNSEPEFTGFDSEPEPTRAERLAEDIPDDVSHIQFDVQAENIRRRFEIHVDGTDIVKRHREWCRHADGDWKRSSLFGEPHRFEDSLTSNLHVEHAEQPLSVYAADRFLTCLRSRLSGRPEYVEDLIDSVEVSYDG